MYMFIAAHCHLPPCSFQQQQPIVSQKAKQALWMYGEIKRKSKFLICNLSMYTELGTVKPLYTVLLGGNEKCTV